MATVRRVYYTRPVPPNAVRVIVKGKPFVRFDGADGKPVTAPCVGDGSRCRVPSAKWYGQYTDANGKVRRVPLSANKDAARLMLSELVKRVENEKAGVIDRFADHRKRPIAAHLTDWIVSLRANGRTPQYVSLKAARVTAVIGGCGWVFPGDMTADRVEIFLSGLRSRRPELPPLPDGAEWFTLKQVGHLLGGVSRQTVAALFRRHRLTGTGRGKSRRFPRAAVETLRDLKDRGCSAQTSNHYLQAIQQFARWLMDNGRIDRSPFTRLKPLNARLDQRRRRGELSPSELGRLLAVTAAGGIKFRGLTGADRVMLYRLAVGTGFRAAELAALVPEFFDLNATPPAILLPAELSKNRKGAVQPVAAGLASDLRGYLAGRPIRERVWPGTWVGKAADMLRADLDAAGVPVEVDGPEGNESRDFHALRACFISNVIRAGADLKQVMTLARHSDPRLTAGRYARTRLHDLGAVVDKLPEPTTTRSETGVLKATGTDGSEADRLPSLTLPLALVGGIDRGRMSADENMGREVEVQTCSPNPLNPSVLRADEGERGGKRKRPRPDSNRGITVLQTAALPLGYEATTGHGNAIGSSDTCQSDRVRRNLRFQSLSQFTNPPFTFVASNGIAGSDHVAGLQVVEQHRFGIHEAHTSFDHERGQFQGNSCHAVAIAMEQIAGVYPHAAHPNGHF